MSTLFRTIAVVLLCLGVVFGTSSYSVAQTKTSSAKKTQKAEEATEAKEVNTVNVKFFDAMKDGLVKVDVTANNAFSANVRVRNMTEDHLVIDLPTSFALTPVIAQYGGGGGYGGYGGGMGGYGGGGYGGMGGGMMGGMGGMGGMMGGMGGQSMGGGYGGRGGGMGGMGGYGGGMGGYGGGMGGYGGGMGGYGGGGGYYNVEDNLQTNNQRNTGRSYSLPPEKSITETVRTLCLEHGKPDPTPAMRYEIRKLSEVTTRKEVQVLCELRGDDAVDPNVAQAAAWNLNNDLSWDDLQKKQYVTIGERRAPRPYFAPEVLEMAQRLSADALVIGEQLKVEEDKQKREEQSKDLLEYAMELDEQ